MSGLFCRINADRSENPIPLEDMFGGPFPATCWLVGGGASFNKKDAAMIEKSPAPIMTINLSGTGLFRPDFWTSYDPSVRFHQSIYLDPGVMKFVHKRRAMDLVPETSYKVCDCPNLYFFERDRERQFADFVSPKHKGIVDWADSFVQAIDLLYRLGFRRILLAGCEMRIPPSEKQREKAGEVGVVYESGELLREFVKRCQRAGLTESELEDLQRETQYHFDEQKSLRAAINSEFHYFRIAQYLRLSRRAMALAGLQLISVTPDSRLNDYFPYETVEEAIERIYESTGNPAQEKTRGLYQQLIDRRADFKGPMRDFKPPYDPNSSPAPEQADHDEQKEILVENAEFVGEQKKRNLKAKLERRRRAKPEIIEEG